MPTPNAEVAGPAHPATPATGHPSLSIGPGLEAVPFTILKKMARLNEAIDPTVFEAPGRYDADELALQAGASKEQVEKLARWVGRPVQQPGAKLYTDSHVVAVRQALAFAKAQNLDDSELGALIRSMASAMERLAARQVESIVDKIATTEQVGDTNARLIAAERTPSQIELLLPLLSHVYRRYFASTIRRLTLEAIAQRGLNNDDADYPLVRAIGFADMVNFTARIEKVSPRELGEIIRAFQATSWDIVNENRGRVVNFIGDQVFFVADSITDGARIALNLAAPGALGLSGPVRVGLGWCRVITTEGDIFGPGVNLTARVCAAAAPGEVFLDAKAARILSHYSEFSVVPQPQFEARGIGTVSPSRLRYAADSRT